MQTPESARKTMIKNQSNPSEITTPPAGLLPFLPMLYVTWADGVLTPSELQMLQRKVARQRWLDAAERDILCSYLDPARPPEACQLQEWLAVIRDMAPNIPDAAKKSLAELGLEMAKIGAASAGERCTSAEACAALEEIEAALGIAGPEATQDLLPAPEPEKAESAPVPAFDIAGLSAILQGEHAAVREKVKIILSDPAFRYRYGLPKEEYRELVLRWCQALAQQGLGALSYPDFAGGENDLGKFIAAFETIALHDLSLTVKFGVQFGLFGGSILNLGTEKHHKKYLRRAGTLALPGCFAMTELGHGSNVRDIETTATFDAEQDGFVIHTPTESARKDYIGNAARHGRLATVFARLVIGAQEHGVHAFLVPIRSKDGQPLPGVKIADCGEKLGLNGVDNGRLWFDHVFVPRENLLDRFATVGADGSYSSPIPGASQRFFTMLGTLVGGRISVSAAALSATKSALAIAIRYADRRRQFGPPGAVETLLLDYPAHQRRLLPLLAKAYVIDSGVKYATKRYVQRGATDAREVEVLAAAIKVYATWNATETIQTCRESCGGQGYLAENRFAALKADTDVFTTFEGDNTVLLQLVAKGLLTEYKQHFSDMKLVGLVKYISRRASAALSELNPLITHSTDPQHLRDGAFHLNAFIYREHALLASAARRIKKRLQNGLSVYEAFIDVQDHLLNLAKAHAERVLLETFQSQIAETDDAGVAAVLRKLSSLFALSRIEHDRGWFLENGLIETGKARAIRKQVDLLCAELRPQAAFLVEAFGIPDTLLAAPIAV